MENHQRITVLLSEYAALRSELVSRYTAQLQAIAALAIVLIGLLSFGGVHGFKGLVTWLVIAAVATYLVVLFLIDLDIARTSARVRRIETDVNSLAGEPLLSWESTRAIGGFVGRRVLACFGYDDSRLGGPLNPHPQQDH
jgi:hypothetical protein